MYTYIYIHIYIYTGGSCLWVRVNGILSAIQSWRRKRGARGRQGRGQTGFEGKGNQSGEHNKGNTWRMSEPENIFDN